MAPFFTGIAKGSGGAGGFGFGRRTAVSLRQFIQYYLFTSPGSFNFNTANNFGFIFSSNAKVDLLTIGNGNSGSGSGGPGGSSGSGLVSVDVPLPTIAPGGTFSYTIGTLSGGTPIGGPINGGPPSNPAGDPGTFPGLPTYAPRFDLYTLSAGSGGNRGYPDFSGHGSAGGGGGAGGLLITKTNSDTPLIFGPTVGVTTATPGSNAGCTGPGNPAQDPGVPKCGGGGGVGGTGYGSGGGGGGAPYNNAGAVGPGGGGGAGNGGVFLIKVSEIRS